MDRVRRPVSLSTSSIIIVDGEIAIRLGAVHQRRDLVERDPGARGQYHQIRDRITGAQALAEPQGREECDGGSGSRGCTERLMENGRRILTGTSRYP